jgi:outer membrane protein assembly factor BamE (lipoprotein component of BamABCDE complex)
MSILKRVDVAALAAILYAAVFPAIAAAGTYETGGGVAVKWWMRVVAPPQRVTNEAVQRIQPGMDEDGVEALIGAPWRTVRFPLSQTTAWDYSYRDSWGYDSVFSVTFNDEHVVVSRMSIRHNF